MGLAGLLGVFIREVDHKEIYADYDCLYMTVSYPWQFSEDQKKFTHDEFVEMVSKWVNRATDQIFGFGTMEVEDD